MSIDQFKVVCKNPKCKKKEFSLIDADVTPVAAFDGSGAKCPGCDTYNEVDSSTILAALKARGESGTKKRAKSTWSQVKVIKIIPPGTVDRRPSTRTPR